MLACDPAHRHIITNDYTIGVETRLTSISGDRYTLSNWSARLTVVPILYLHSDPCLSPCSEVSWSVPQAIESEPTGVIDAQIGDSEPALLQTTAWELTRLRHRCR